MNKEQLAILAAFDAAMQTFVEVWDTLDTTREQCAASYGGASAILILVKQHTDSVEGVTHAAILLNQAAEQLGLSQTN